MANNVNNTATSASSSLSTSSSRLDWKEEAYFRAAVDAIPNGKRMQYAYRQDENAPARDLTQFEGDQVFWGKDKVPEVLLRILPSASWVAEAKLVQQNKAPLVPDLVVDGEKVYEYVTDKEGQAPKVLRDFPMLPKVISRRPSEFWVETMIRSDPRMALEDIRARMKCPRELKPTRAGLQNNVMRWRKENGLISWRTAASNATTDRDSILATFSAAELQDNLRATPLPKLLKTRFSVEPKKPRQRGYKKPAKRTAATMNAETSDPIEVATSHDGESPSKRQRTSTTAAASAQVVEGGMANVQEHEKVDAQQDANIGHLAAQEQAEFNDEDLMPDPTIDIDVNQVNALLAAPQQSTDTETLPETVPKTVEPSPVSSAPACGQTWQEFSQTDFDDRPGFMDQQKFEDIVDSFSWE